MSATRYVAFLRAINVGGHVVKMDRLRNLFEALGFSGVRTFIASGNVLFDSAARNTGALESRTPPKRSSGSPPSTGSGTPGAERPARRYT